MYLEIKAVFASEASDMTTGEAPTVSVWFSLLEWVYLVLMKI